MLPGLLPAHTRKGLYHAKSVESSGSRLIVEKVAPVLGSFVVSEASPLWLLPAFVAETELEKDIQRLAFMLGKNHTPDIEARLNKLFLVLGRSSLNNDGCIENGLRGQQQPVEYALLTAELETGLPCMTPVGEVDSVRICGNDRCYNARHYNFDFGKKMYTQKPVELNPDWYLLQPDGSIETIWGDTLPPVIDSLRYFIDFQYLNYPFVDYEDSLLSSTPMSQIKVHPITGCWQAAVYETNTQGLANTKNGYGVMYAREKSRSINLNTGEITQGYRRGSVLAHILIWELTGHTLIPELERNHLCNYPRCCNPLHIEQIDPGLNRTHGQRARAAINRLPARNHEAEHLYKLQLKEAEAALVQAYIDIVGRTNLRRLTTV
ncbi:hypothetical protein H6798_03020 [Candidatus Nomurabacteria bacterium]|nr:hypothetical protein [Candidatus Nomurabacteria bacterium]